MQAIDWILLAGVVVLVIGALRFVRRNQGGCCGCSKCSGSCPMEQEQAADIHRP